MFPEDEHPLFYEVMAIPAVVMNAIMSSSSVVDPRTSDGQDTDPYGPLRGCSDTDSGEVDSEFIGASVDDQALGSMTGMGTYTKSDSVTQTAGANEEYPFVPWISDAIKHMCNGKSFTFTKGYIKVGARRKRNGLMLKLET